MQHKHTGMGYIDIMKDIQILDSVLTRQLLDSIYKINVRRKKIVKLTMAAIIKAL